MSLSPVSAPKRFKDNQFIGDLMNLFERRKIKTGDPRSFENFAAELGSNDAFRSQLFTLCTAISHMSAEDLSGEQLLALVARALGGPGLPKRDGTVEVPDSMRSAFLAGYDAWSNRGFEPKEPLPWPTQPQQEPSPEPNRQPLSSSQPAGAPPETIAPKPPAPGSRTVQEALDIARERSLADPAAHRLPPGTNLQGLTLSEIKTLLQDIEHRVDRIQPHLHELASHDLASAARTPADAFGRREKMHEIDAPHPVGTPASDAQPPASPAALDSAQGQSSHRASRPSRINEAAFLARHAYLRPAPRRAAPAAPGVAIASPAANPAASLPAVAAVASPLPIPEPVAVPPPPELSLAVAPPPPAAVVSPIPAAPVVAQPVPAMLAPLPLAALAVRPDPIPYIPPVEPAPLSIGRLRVSPAMAIGSFAAFLLFLVVVSGLAGIFVYPFLHPKTIADYPGLSSPARTDPAPSQNSATPPAVASGVQVIVAESGDPFLTSRLPQSSRRAAGAAASKSYPAFQPQTPGVAVWPPSNQAASRAAVAASEAPPAASRTVAPPRAAPPAKPVYVPSATMIAYALSTPQPAYPADQPRGINGTVVLQIAISRDGGVTDIRTVSGPIELRPAAVQAVQAWRFRPYLVNGSPTPVVTTLGFLFKGQ